MNYLFLKHSHLTFVTLSFLLFNLRFFCYACRKKTMPKWLKITPHIVDTLLLLSALSLVFLLRLSPVHTPWLLAKIIVLICYIGFGSMAMKSQGYKQWFGFLLAYACFADLVVTAITKNPWWFMT